MTLPHLHKRVVDRRRRSLGVVLLVRRSSRPWLAPHDPLEQDLLAASLPPAWRPAAIRVTGSAPTASAATSCRA